MRQYIDTLQDGNGNALVGATVLVQNYVGGANATIFSDNGLTPIATSTVTTGADGQFSFFAADGDYNLVMSKSGTMFKTQSPVSMFDGAAQLTVQDVGSINNLITNSSALEKALRTGLRSWIKVAYNNTGATTYSYNGLAAKPVVNAGGTALLAGQLLAGSIYQMEYNGTAWQLAAPPGPSYYGVTTAETLGVSSLPTNLTIAVGNALRYGADPTGGNDSTTALTTWLNASWSMFNYLDGQGLWAGGGGASPVATLPPGKYQMSGTLTAPSSFTMQAAGPPANTVSHTRLIMNSNGITPARTWAGGATIKLGASIQATSGGTLYRYYSSAGGVSGGSTPAWAAGLGSTTTDGTVSWVNQGACTNTDNRNKPLMKFSRATVPGGSTLQDQALVVRLQGLEFWEVTPGGTFSAPLSGSSPALGDYPLGGLLYFDTDVTDSRIEDCVFQNSPCAVRLNNIKSGQVASDGFANQGNCNIWFEQCEFDAGAAHIYATNVQCDLVFRNCAFYGGTHTYVNCTGKVIYKNCRWYGGAYVDASASSNAFSVVVFKGNEFEQQSNYDNFSIYGANQVDVEDNTFSSPTSLSTIVLNNCNQGVVANNNINDSGYNTSQTTGGITAACAIKLIDNIGLLVHGNNIGATDSATYGGFGIATISSVRGSSKNFINNNLISAPYTGAAYGGQTRRINLASNADIVGINYDPNGWIIPKRAPIAQTRYTLPYSASVTIPASSGDDFVLSPTDANAFTMNAPTNPSEGQRITVKIRNTSGGNLGTVTWNSVFKMYTWSSPVNGGSFTIGFEFDGTNWVEDFRTANAVSN